MTRLGAGIGYLITERRGGVSAGPFGTLNLALAVGDDPLAVTENRQRVATSCGLRREDIAWMTQVHGTAVRRAGPGWPGEAAEPCDATFTDAPRLALAVQVADCVPVLVADPVGRLVGAAHAGRAGVAAGVVPALVTAMADAGGQPGRMRALIGPAVCGACYEVPAAMRDEVSAVVPEVHCQTRAGTAGLDLAAGVAAQLAAAGVRHVSSDGRCTRESADLFSYRRDGTTGRFAALVWLEP